MFGINLYYKFVELIYTVELCCLDLEGTVKMCSSYRKFEPLRSRNFREKKSGSAP